MIHPFPFDERRLAYVVRLLAPAVCEGTGLRAASGECLRWSDIQRVLCADVGEPEGVRTLVFDLVLDVRPDEVRVARVDADPGPAAQALAGALLQGLPGDCSDAELREVAKDGLTNRWFPDLESFEDANTAQLERELG